MVLKAFSRPPSHLILRPALRNLGQGLTGDFSGGFPSLTDFLFKGPLIKALRILPGALGTLTEALIEDSHHALRHVIKACTQANVLFSVS